MIEEDEEVADVDPDDEGEAAAATTAWARTAADLLGRFESCLGPVSSKSSGSARDFPFALAPAPPPEAMIDLRLSTSFLSFSTSLLNWSFSASAAVDSALAR